LISSSVVARGFSNYMRAHYLRLVSNDSSSWCIEANSTIVVDGG